MLLTTNLPTLPAARAAPGLFVSPLNHDLLDPLIRLVGLLQELAHAPVLAPLVRRELFYRLLLSEQGAVLRRVAATSSQFQHVAAGIAWLQHHALQPIRMEELARKMRMSPSTMYTWFKTVTHMSPLQFQKQLRLQEARRMLLAETADATIVSQRVGYESPSQFSREYRRLFGLPSLQDIERLRTRQGEAHAAERGVRDDAQLVANM